MAKGSLIPRLSPRQVVKTMAADQRACAIVHLGCCLGSLRPAASAHDYTCFYCFCGCYPSPPDKLYFALSALRSACADSDEWLLAIAEASRLANRRLVRAQHPADVSWEFTWQKL